MVVNNRLIIGERITDNVNRDIPSGVVRAYDPVTGRPVWAWDVGRSADAIAPLGGDEVYTRGTPNVWGAITADAANGIVYLGTGNASPDYSSDTGSSMSTPTTGSATAGRSTTASAPRSLHSM